MKERFDKEGRLIFPKDVTFPTKTKVIVKDKSILVTQAYCKNGHNLVRGEKVWDGNKGITLVGKIGNKRMNINLSPYQGDDRKILDGAIERGEILKLLCPECGVAFELFSPCKCGADIVYMYLTEELDARDSICICSRYGCRYSCLTSRGKIVSELTV
jgi:hypothetical protein